jgi:NAD(P)-dependent dehydrogenase (short-subunit alcohol dehydrogenase family)
VTTETALVTGCSSGIGRETAIALGKRGWRVYATARDPDDVASLADRGITADVRSPGGVHSATSSRSVTDYARLAFQTVRQPTDRYDLVHANYGLTAPMAVAQPRLPVVVSLWGSDLMGQYGPLTEQVVRFADEVIVPVQAHFLSAMGARQHVDDVLALVAGGVDVKVSMVVPTVFDKQQVMARQVLESLQRAYGHNMVADPIPNNVTVKEAPGVGLTVLEYAPDSQGGEAY